MNRLVVLYEKNYKFYFRIVFKIVGNIDDVEDILQTAFTKVYNSDNSHMKDDELKKWFVTVCKNTAKSFVLKKKKDLQREQKYYLENDIQKSMEDEVIFNAVVEQYLKSLPSEWIPYFKEYIIDDVPLRVICRKYGLNRDKMRYWKRKLKNIIKNAI